MLGFSPESYDTIVPRTFRMKRVEIDPKTLENEQPPVQQERKNPAPVPMDQEIPQPDQAITVKIGKSLLIKPQESLSIEKPEAQTPQQGLDSLLKSTDSATTHEPSGDFPKSAEDKLALDTEEALKLPDTKQQDLVHGMEKSVPPQGIPNGSPQFSSLDDLLAKSGTVKKNTAPILMPTDLLFEYDSDALKPAATATLTKLGSLIKRNSKASFRIEGHTDSFGTEEYNNGLSLRRAEAVKNWLGINMGIDASRVSTIGLGKSRLLVPTGSVEQQQLNRRVEIVISVPK